MADVHLLEPRHREHRADVPVGQPVSRVGFNAIFGAQGCTIGNPHKFGSAYFALAVRVSPGMQLNHWRAQPHGGLYLTG